MTHRFRAAAVVGLLVGVVWLAVAAAAFAHAVPVQTLPRANATLDAAPSEISILFSEPVVPALSRITVLTQSGETVETGPLQTDDDGRGLSVSLPALGQGAYLVSWQVLSSVDGHTTNGTFSFGVGTSALAAGTTTVSARFSALSAAARALTLAGTALLIGLFTFRLAVWRPFVANDELSAEESALDRALLVRSATVGLVGVALLGLGLALVLLDRLISIGAAGSLGAWFATTYGRMWLLRLGLGVAAAGLLLVLRRRAAETTALLLGGLALSLLVAATTSMTSHSAALLLDRTPATVVDFSHIAAAGVWVGGLVFLLLSVLAARRLPADGRMWLSLNLILNFSAVAAGAVGVLLLSGGYLAWQHVGTWSALVGTAYGRVLLAKLGLALVAFVLAGVNLWVIKPRLSAAYDAPESPAAATSVRRFRTIVTIETVVAVAIIAAAGLLSDMQRGREAPLIAGRAGQLQTTQTVDGLNVSLWVEPALVGQNSFSIRATDERGNPVPVNEVDLRFTYLNQALGADSGRAAAAPDGSHTLDGSYISLAGAWQVEAAVRRPEGYDVFVPFRLDAALNGQIRSAEAGTSLGDRFVRLMGLGAGLATGVLIILLALVWGVVATRAANRPWQLVPLLGVSLLLFWLGSSQILIFFERDYTPSRFLRNTETPDAESIAIGQRLYEQKCASCHGPEGYGDGPAAASLPSLPVNFTDGHTATHLDGDLFYWIQNGIEGTPMPAFGAELSREETWHLVNYIRRLIDQSAVAYTAAP